MACLSHSQRQLHEKQIFYITLPFNCPSSHIKIPSSVDGSITKLRNNLIGFVKITCKIVIRDNEFYEVCQSRHLYLNPDVSKLSQKKRYQIAFMLANERKISLIEL